MDSLRRIHGERLAPAAVCCRCQNPGRRWDRIASEAYCPACVEALAQGEASPLVLRTDAQCCAVCDHNGIVRYVTFPLYDSLPVEVDLCPEHLRGLLGRRLGPHAFQRLRRELHKLGLTAEDVFLLHEAFYDVNGQALQPAVEPT
jgi:hypothetical protein